MDLETTTPGADRSARVELLEDHADGLVVDVPEDAILGILEKPKD